MCVTAVSKIEAELRKSQKHIARSEKYMTMWRAQTLDLKMALLVSNYDHIHACFTLDKYPARQRKASMRARCLSILPCRRRSLLLNRRVILRSAVMSARLTTNSAGLIITRTAAYERAMLNENGGVVTRTQEFEPGGQVLSRGEWLTILRVNRSKGR